MGKAGVGKAAHRRREVGEDLAEEGGREARQRATDAGEGGVQLEHRGKLEADEGAERHAVMIVRGKFALTRVHPPPPTPFAPLQCDSTPPLQSSSRLRADYAALLTRAAPRARGPAGALALL